jgi:glycosyltransferase involved in cell wall biosynthesis
MLIPALGVGGAEGSFLRLARFLSTRAEVTIAVMGGAYSEPSTGGWTDLQVVRLAEDFEDHGKVRRWWQMVRKLRALKRNHDVTVSFLSGGNLLNALTGPRARTIVSERGSKRQDTGRSQRQRLIWTRLLDPLTYVCAGRIVAASQGLAHEIVTANPWAAARVVAIEGTVNGEELVETADLPVEADLMPLADCETVVAFGRLHMSKGYDTLLAAFANVRSARPGARLLLIGEGPEGPQLRLLAERLGLSVANSGAEADVILPGMRPHPLRYLSLGKVFALTSRFEGLPNAVIEAMAAGIPILASDCCWGPRSLLSAGTLPYGGPQPALPLVLQYGVLLPVPDAPGAIALWSGELQRALDGRPQRPPRSERLAAVERYGIARNGPIWLQLAEDMAQRAGHR